MIDDTPRYGRRGIGTDQLPRLPRALLHNSAAQGTISGTAKVPTLDVVDYDTHGLVVSTAGPWVKVARPGLYYVRFSGEILTAAAVTLLADLLVNGAGYDRKIDAPAANAVGAVSWAIETIIPCNRGDTLGAQISQFSGGALNLSAARVKFLVAWLGNL